MRIEADEMSEFDPRSRFENVKRSDALLHQSIFCDAGTGLSFSGREIVQRNRTAEDRRIEMVLVRPNSQKQTIIAGGRASGSARAEIDISWGGSEGTKTEVSVSGGISHDSGAYIEGSASQDSDGRGSVSIDAGVDTKSDR